MPELKKRSLGTPRDEAPVGWVIHQTGSYLIGELFGGSYYRDCLKMAKAMASQHRPALTAIHKIRHAQTVDLERMIAHLEDVSRWAAEIESESFHTVNMHSFITLWAAQEAGIENVIAEIIRTSNYAAEIASKKFASGKYPVSGRPWSESTCLEIAQKLDTKAKNATKDGGEDIARRVTTLFSWFDLNVQMDDPTAKKYNEASMVRNVILHRYGYLNSQNVESFPELSEWVGEILPITTELLTGYYNAIMSMHLAISRAIWSSQYK
jgi:hypothetical protein